MDEISFATPALIKLGSFGGKTKYCLIDTFFIPILNHFQLTIEQETNRLIVVARRRMLNNEQTIPLHQLVWEYFHRCRIPKTLTLYHRNGIAMDNRLENLLLISNNLIYRVCPSSIIESFYWKLISSLPIDMDEVEHHRCQSSPLSFIECHHSPCSNLLSSSVTEQFQCLICKKIKYCSQTCQMLDFNVHSIFCNPVND